MKSLKKLIVPLALLVVALVAFLIARGIAKNDEKNYPPETEAADTKISLIEFSADLVSRVSYVSDLGEVSVDKDGEKYSLTSDNGFPLDQTKAETLVSDALGLSASGKISPTGTDDEYGLENPAKKVVITLKNGGKTTVEIGDYNPYSDIWYARIDGGGGIYLLSTDVTEDFELSLDDLIAHEKFTVPPSGRTSVKTVTLDFTSSDGTVFTYVPAVPEVTDDDGNVTSEAVPDGFTIKTGEGETLSGDEATEKGNAVYAELTGIDLTSWYAYNVTDAGELSKYGLSDDAPFCRATIVYTETVTVAADDSSSSVTREVEKSTGLLIGSVVTENAGEDDPETEGEADRFVRIAGGKIVYAVPESELEAILSLS